MNILITKTHNIMMFLVFSLSGPGIVDLIYLLLIIQMGSINLAIVPGSNPPLPITISSVNSF